MLEITNHPSPIQDPTLVTVTLSDDDEPSDFELPEVDPQGEQVAARTEFTWTVRFTVSGTWVADGFDLDHERAMEMLRKDLDYAYEHELGAQVLTCPPSQTIRAMQGGREADAQAGQAVLDQLLAAAVARARIAR